MCIKKLFKIFKRKSKNPVSKICPLCGTNIPLKAMRCIICGKIQE